MDAVATAISSSTLLVFYVMLCLGTGLWFILSLIFGEATDMISDAIDGVDFGDADDSGSILSVRNILLFCMGFGGGGAIAVALGAGLWGSIVAGTGGGVAIAAVGIVFFRVLRRQEATTNYDSSLLAGSTGTVTLEISPGRTGEISARDNRGAAVRLSATASKHVDEALPVGAVVTIMSIHDGTAIVAPFDE